MIFASGLGVPEGPVLLEDGSFLVVEMSPDRGCVSRVSPDGNHITKLAVTGRPNGLALDRSQKIWVAESQDPSVIVLDLEGRELDRFRGSEDRPFLFPNDLAFGPDGLLYFTDSGILFEDFAPGGVVRADWRTVETEGCCYRLDTQTRELTLVCEGLRFPNGLAFDRDGDLYINETLTGAVRRYTADTDYSHSTLFGNVWETADFEEIQGPDGMKFAADGSLFITVFGQGDVTVLDPSGTVSRRITTHGSAPTNLVFGAPGTESIYVTEDAEGTLEIHHVGVDGLELHYGD